MDENQGQVKNKSVYPVKLQDQIKYRIKTTELSKKPDDKKKLINCFSWSNKTDKHLVQDHLNGHLWFLNVSRLVLN